MAAPTVSQEAVVVTTTEAAVAAPAVMLVPGPAPELAAAVTAATAELDIYTFHNSIMYSATVVNMATVAAAELVLYTCHNFILYSAKVVNAAAAAETAPLSPLARWTNSNYNL